MFKDAIVRARVNEEIKEEAAAVLSSIGLTVSDAFRMMLLRIVHEKALPFSPLVPNAITIKAMREAKKGNLYNAKSVENLFETLMNEND